MDRTDFAQAVVHLVVDYEKIVARLSGRRQCPVCGTLYNLTTNPPKVAGKCDREGAFLVTREDDKETVIRERLHEYDSQTVPILSFFRKAGVSLFEINGGEDSPERVLEKFAKRWPIRACFRARTVALLKKVYGRDRAAEWCRAREIAAQRFAGVPDPARSEGMVSEGVTTQELEVAAEKMIADAGAKPAFKGYYTQASGTKYPFVLCASVNEEVVHGMPSVKRKLKPGDIVSLDTGVLLDGYYGDSALTVPVGEVNDSVKRLLKVTEESLEMAIDRVRAGNRLFDICGTVEKHVVSQGFSIVREFVGHGIGTSLHEEPQIPNYVDRRGENPRLETGYGAGD